MLTIGMIVKVIIALIGHNDLIECNPCSRMSFAKNAF